MTTRRVHTMGRALAGLCLVVTLSGCWNDDDDDVVAPAATSQVPAAASENVAGFMVYLAALAVSSAETLEPVDTAAVTPPTDETSEPSAVD